MTFLYWNSFHLRNTYFTWEIESSRLRSKAAFKSESTYNMIRCWVGQYNINKYLLGQYLHGPGWSMDLVVTISPTDKNSWVRCNKIYPSQPNIDHDVTI